MSTLGEQSRRSVDQQHSRRMSDAPGTTNDLRDMTTEWRTASRRRSETCPLIAKRETSEVAERPAKNATWQNPRSGRQPVRQDHRKRYPVGRLTKLPSLANSNVTAQLEPWEAPNAVSSSSAHDKAFSSGEVTSALPASARNPSPTTNWVRTHAKSSHVIG